jgi:HlyD family secretion protein
MTEVRGGLLGMKKDRKKRLMLLGPILVVLLGGIFLISYWTSPSELVLEGVVETNIYAHYSEVAGKIIELPVELGQEVKAGDVLAVLDDSKERFALEQLDKTLAIKKAILSELTTGLDSEELKQYQNNVKLAEIAYDNALLTQERSKQDYEDALSIWEAGALAQSELDKIKYQADLAEAAVKTAAMQLDNARQQLALGQKGTPQEKIDAAQGDVALTEVQIRQTKDNLSKYTITALQDGTIISKNYLVGNMVSPGYDLVDIASATEKYLITYVPKEHLSSIKHGQKVVIRSDEKEYKGTVYFIDVKAQYTPKDMQSTANRNKESMRIKIKLEPEIPLKVGERAKVVLF